MGSGARERLPEGTHAFAFSLKLPDSSPEMTSSFEGEHGCVRYYLRAELDEYTYACHRIISPLTVIRPYDISGPDFMVRQGWKFHQKVPLVLPLALIV